MQRGSFPLKGSSLESAAFDWWKELKKKMQVEIGLEKIIADGEDFTQKIKAMENRNIEL